MVHPQITRQKLPNPSNLLSQTSHFPEYFHSLSNHPLLTHLCKSDQTFIQNQNTIKSPLILNTILLLHLHIRNIIRRSQKYLRIKNIHNFLKNRVLHNAVARCTTSQHPPGLSPRLYPRSFSTPNESM